MKKKELIPLYKHLVSLGKISGVRFAYAISKNKKIVKDAIDLFSGILIESPRFKEYENKRVELCTKYGLKDSNGKPMIVGIEFVIDPTHESEFKNEMHFLQTEYAQELEEYSKNTKEYTDFLEGDIDPDMQFVMIPKEILPEELTSEQLDPIMFLIVE